MRWRQHPVLTSVVGHRIRTERVRAKLSRAQVSEFSDLTLASLSRYESGNACPSIGALCSLAHAFGCEPAALMPSTADVARVFGRSES